MAIEEQDDDSEESNAAGGHGATGDFSTVGSKFKDGEYLAAWGKLKDEHPNAYLAAAIAPGTGQVAALADYAEAMKAGDSVEAASAAASFIPAVKAVKAATKIGRNAHFAGKAATAADGGREIVSAYKDKRKAEKDSYTGSWGEE